MIFKPIQAKIRRAGVERSLRDRLNRDLDFGREVCDLVASDDVAQRAESDVAADSPGVNSARMGWFCGWIVGHGV
jgi:hypothetical protein